MGLKRYDVEVNGRRTTLKLSDEDAKKMGLTTPADPEPKSKTPENKARQPANKRDDTAAQAMKSAQAMNKPSKADG